MSLAAEPYLIYRIPENIRSNNGPEFSAEALRRWLERIGAELTIQPGRKRAQ